MLSAWADGDIHTILPWSNGRLSPGDCRLNKFHNNKGTDVTADLSPLLSTLSSLSGWYCLNRLFRNMRWDRWGGSTNEEVTMFDSVCGFLHWNTWVYMAWNKDRKTFTFWSTVLILYIYIYSIVLTWLVQDQSFLYKVLFILIFYWLVLNITIFKVLFLTRRRRRRREYLMSQVCRRGTKG